MFKWGILGLGRIAHKFASELHETGIGKVVAVGSRELSKANSFADQYDIEKRFGSYDIFIDEADVDAVYISVPHHLHFTLTAACLKKRLPVLCEKPFTINQKELSVLIALARQHHTFLMEAMWTRFMPHIIWLKKIVDDKTYGNILHIKAEFCFKGKERGIQLGLSRLLENELGGGALLDIGIYPIFLSLLLLGVPSTIQALSSIVNNIDESSMVLFNYTSSATAYLESSILWESEGQACVYFEDATITIPRRWHENNEIHIKEKSGVSKIEQWTYPSRGFYYEMKEVQECVQLGKTESELMPLDFSMSLMQTLDRIRKIIGLKYPADAV